MLASSGDELSPEERAISTMIEGTEVQDQGNEMRTTPEEADEDGETAALAEGRTAPPTSDEQA
jgi:hypothetical protein